MVDIGLASTDMLYFASGALDVPGAMFTASHNPAKYNGIKLCRAGAAPIGADTGLATIREAVEQGVPAPAPGTVPGTVEKRDMLADYAAYLRGLVDLSTCRPLRVVVDAGNGMAGYTVPEVLAGLPLDVVPLYFELDGTFPNHEANPLDPANLVDLQKAVVAEGADIGLAFDGDADRCFVVDERGEPVSPSAITGLVAVRELAKAPGSTVIHNLITSQAVPEIVAEHGGTPVRTRVGHSFIKQVMAETGAVFGGEHSAHYYFRDFWRADSGMLAALHVLAALGESDGPLSALMADYERYAASGEVNSTVADARAKDRRDQGALRGAGRGDDGRARRAHRRAARRLVVQPAPEQHRAAAAAQRRGRGRRDDGRAARRGPRGRPRLTIRPPTAPRRRPHGRRTGPTDVPLVAPRAVGPVGPGVGAADGARWQHRTSTGAAGTAHDAALEGGRPWPSRSTPG